MAVSIFPANPSLTDSNGDIIAGGSVRYDVKNTTTLVDLFRDRAGVIPQTNPVDIDAAGNLPPVYVSAADEAAGIKATIYDSDGVVVQVIDDIAQTTTGGSAGLFATDFGVDAASTADQRVVMQSAIDQAAAVGQRLDVTGTVLASTAGNAFDGTFTTAAREAGIKVGSQTIDDTVKLRIGSVDGTGVLKAHVADSDATPLVVENIGVVDIARGFTFDGNLANGSSGVANAFTFAGVSEVYIPDMVAKNYRTARVCGSRERGFDTAHIGNFRGKNCMGSAALFLGKPFGGKNIRHTGTIEIDGLDGAGRGAVTIDNDSTASDADQTPTSVTASGTTVTVNATAHGFAIGDFIVLSGADQGQYNQMAEVLTVPTVDSFTFTARKAPAVSPATGTLVLRPSGGPMENLQLDRISARNLTSDSSLFALKAEDGAERITARYVEAINLNEASASTALGASRIAPGNADWPIKYVGYERVYAENTYFCQDIIIGKADIEVAEFASIVGNDAGVGLNVSPQNDIQYHGLIDRLSATVQMSGKWTGNDRSYAAIITNADSGENIVNVLNLNIPSHSEGGAGVAAIKGVGRVNMTFGHIKGGFSVENTNPNSSGSFVQQIAAICIAGAQNVNITGDYADLGGRGLSTGKPGAGMELHATDTIKVRGVTFDGGTGNDQIGGPLLRLSVLETPADMTTLCTVILEGCIFRNASEGINLDDVTGVPSGQGYKLILRDCVFESTVTTDIANVARYESVTVDGVVVT